MSVNVIKSTNCLKSFQLSVLIHNDLDVNKQSMALKKEEKWKLMMVNGSIELLF